MTLLLFGEAYDIELKKERYKNNGNLAIKLFDKADGSPFATLTKNMNVNLPDNQAFVDTHNCPWAEDFIRQNGIGTFARRYERSGRCVYPLYIFSI